MNPAEVAALLAGDQHDYEAALRVLPKLNASADVISQLLNELEQSTLANSESERRLITVYTRLHPTSDEEAQIASAAASVTNSVIRNAVLQLLPPQARSGVFRRKSGPFTVVAPTESKPIAVVEPIPEESVRIPREPDSHVVILSKDADAATTRRLMDAGFGPQRYETVEELERALSGDAAPDICAFFVEASFLSDLDRAQQESLITRLASYSSFPFLRFPEDGRKINKEVVIQLVRNARFLTHDPSALQLSFREQAGIREREVQEELSAARTGIAGPTSGIFIPADLSEQELALLSKALARHASNKGIERRIAIRTIRIRSLPGGSTGAKVVLAQINDDAFPVVVKIATKDSITSEASRFMAFIANDDHELRPDICFHGGIGLIIFDVIAGAGADPAPAPTLESRLTNLWYSEMRGTDVAPEASQLLEAFANAVEKLRKLNLQRCQNDDFDCYANPHLKTIESVEEVGFSWNFGEHHVQARIQAAETLRRAERLATCHGDSHGKNILVRRDQGFLIDYQYSGPGHPCVDLARLELSVFLTHFRPFGLESDVIALVRDMSDWNCTEGQILERHKNIIRSKTNELVVRLCLRARGAALSVVESYGLDYEHHRAAKLLLSWQSLIGTSVSHSVVRATVLALS